MTPEQWHDQLLLIAALSNLNHDIGRYVLRTLDADAGRAEPTSTAAEHELGSRLTEMGTALQMRAARRTAEAAQLATEGQAESATAARVPPSPEL